MSIQAIEANPFLLRLRDEGYSVRVLGDFLLVRPVPYLDANGTVLIGTLAKEVQYDVNHAPTSLGDHTLYFVGGAPHRLDGTSLQADLVADTNTRNLPDGQTANFRFSRKPPNGFTDIHHQVSFYVHIISGPAFEKDPGCDPPIEDVEEETLFKYADSSSTRAAIRHIAAKLDGQRIAIVGLGGTGSYILNFAAKTRVAEIHLFDKDRFETHSAFRAPWATDIGTLKARPSKVAHLSGAYSKLKRGIVPHEYHLEAANVGELAGMSFVFVAVDKPAAKQPILHYLTTNGIPFVDVGMGIHIGQGQDLDGTIRVVKVIGEPDDPALKHIATVEAAAHDDYHSNIQIAELNALNAALAVITWKQHFGFYVDSSHDYLARFIPGAMQMVRLP